MKDFLTGLGVLACGFGVLALLLWALNSYASLPEVYIRAASGRCAAVFVAEGGKRVRKPCSAIDFKKDRHQPTYVPEDWGRGK